MTERLPERLSVTIEGGVADVRLNRPDKMNALDPAMFAGIVEVTERLAEDATVRAVVLSGEGRAFCAGLDMATMAEVGGSGDIRERTHGRSNIWQHAAMAWADLPQPVIAAVHGVCIGGGLQVASGADIVIVAPDARLAVFEVHWGLVPDMGGFVRWRGRVRPDVLAELALTGRDVTGEEAARLGLATRVTADPLAEALALAREIAARSPDAVRGIKRLLKAQTDLSDDDLLLAESEEQRVVIGGANQREAVAARMGKRAAVFV